ncbi:MAG: alpha/beta hydrolase [Sphingomonadaceae bacterium]|nr:alpha/beta hydrolase [Sphingomonadaceae bacterium]
MSAIPFHRPDPDAIPSANPAVLDYIATIERLGHEAPPPSAQLAYGPDRGQRLDVYAPPGAKELPVLVFFHGGAWINGHLGWLRFMAPAVTALPAILVAGTYRLAPRCKWPAQIEDVAAAVRFVHAHARAWGGDPERVVTGGHSAGGQLTALASLQADSPPLAACFPVSCPFSLEHGDVPLESEPGRVYRYLFDPRSQDAEASPLRTIEQARQPFHILWGGGDLDYLISSSREAVARLEAAGRDVTFAELPDSSHFDAHVSLGDPASPWYARLRQAFA